MTTEHWEEFLVLYSRFSLVFYFIHISKYVSPDLPTHSTPPSPLGIHKFVPYICVSISASQINSSVSLFLDSRYNHWLLSGWVPKGQESCGTVSREWITDGLPSTWLPCRFWLWPAVLPAPAAPASPVDSPWLHPSTAAPPHPAHSEGSLGRDQCPDHPCSGSRTPSLGSFQPLSLL